jgi:hypothetical protein
VNPRDLARLTLAAALLALPSAACEGGPGGGSTPPPGPPGGGGSTQPPLPPVGEIPTPHACGVRVSELAIFQGVKIGLMRDGTELTARSIPVIGGRRSYFRAYLAYDGAAALGNVVGRLRVESAGGVQEFEAKGTVADPSSEATLESTLNFDVPGGAILADARVSLTLHRGGSCPGGGVERYPSGDGGFALHPTDTGILKVVLVPIQYNADGSGRLPNLSDAQLQRYRDVLMAMYPTRDVEVTVREPVASTIPLTNDSGWPALLEALREQRAKDGAPSDAYYYGLVEPAGDFRTYCQSSCVAGLSYLVDGTAATRLVGLGVGFATGNIAGETLIHELGHQHGRGHTPCGGGAGVDRSFPYANGSVGEWGLDIRTDPPRLQSPTGTNFRKDIMGYCSPQWISDYTYGAIAQRRSAVSAAGASARLVRPLTEAGELHRTLLADGAGGLSWGRPLEGDVPSGEPEPAHVLDAAGVVVADVTVYRTGYGHGVGASFDVPAPRPGWKALVIPGLAPIEFAATASVPSLAPALAR